MKKSPFPQTFIYSLLVQGLSFGAVATLSAVPAHAVVVGLSGDRSEDTPVDLMNSLWGAASQIWVNVDSFGAVYYTTQDTTMETDGDPQDEGMRLFMGSGAEFKLNTSDIVDGAGVLLKTGTERIKLLESVAGVPVIGIGRNFPDDDGSMVTDRETKFQGQYLDVVHQGNGVVIEGGGSRNQQGQSALTTLSLADSTLEGGDGLRWRDWDTNSKIILKNVSMTVAGNGLDVSASGDQNTGSSVVQTDGLKIKTSNDIIGSGEALLLSGVGAKGTFHDTTIEAKKTGIVVARQADAHFTGQTKITAADAESTGQSGVQASKAATVRVDHLDLSYESDANNYHGGAISAVDEGVVIVGVEGAAERNKIEVFNHKNANSVPRTRGMNAVFDGQITLNHTDLHNFRSTSAGEDISNAVIGIEADYRSQVTLNDSQIIIKDLKDEPFMSMGAGLRNSAGLTLKNHSLIQAGQFAVIMASKSTLAMTDSRLEAGSAGIYAMGQGPTEADAQVSARLNHSQIIATQKDQKHPLGTALRVGMLKRDGVGYADQTVDNMPLGDRAYLTVTADNGSEIAGHYAYRVSRGELALTLDGSRLSGAASIAATSARAADQNVANVTLKNGSVWLLKKDVAFVPEQAAPNYLNVTKLSLDQSELRFDQPKGKQDVQKLAVAQLDGQGGTIELWTELAGDDAATDQVVVREAATGTTGLRIKRLQGEQPDGAQTKVGIQVVAADQGATTAAQAFVLDSGSTGYRAGAQPTLAAGLYDYHLTKGGDGGDAQSWYLNSNPTKTDPVDPVDPVDPIDPVDPVKPTTYRPEVDAYFANRQMAVAMQRHHWQERQEARGEGTLVWARAAHQQERFDNQFGHRRKISSSLIHFGTDVWQQVYEDQSQLSLGAMALVGDGKSKTKNERLKAEGKVQGYNLGVYATWQQTPNPEVGAYVDSWLMHGWFKNKVKGSGLKEEKYDSRSLTASLEAGYGLLLGADGDRRWYLQPQMQVLWSKYTGDDVNEHTQTRVHDQDDHFTAYRLGLRFKADMDRPNGTQLAPFAELSYWRLPKTSHMMFNDAMASDTTPRNVLATTVGLNAKVSKTTDVFGRLSYHVGNEGYRQTGLQLGWKRLW